MPLAPPAPVTYPKVLSFEESVFGFENCAVLVTLNDSARSSALILSVKLKILNSEASALKKFGPDVMLRPLVPKRTPVGAAKLACENHDEPPLAGTLIPYSLTT